MTTGRALNVFEKTCHFVSQHAKHKISPIGYKCSSRRRQSVPQNLLQELRPLVFVVAAIVVSLLTVTLQISVDVDTVEGGRSDGVEALPPEQSPPVVLVCIQDDDAALTSMTLSDGFNKFWGVRKIPFLLMITL